MPKQFYYITIDLIVKLNDKSTVPVFDQVSVCLLDVPIVLRTKNMSFFKKQ